jgi:hypothetical protein
LCGRAIEGLAARDVPLVVPRAHDCITLYLGSRARYNAAFTADPGTYWFTLDYLERHDPNDGLIVLGSVGPSSDAQATYEEYVEKYGKDNADYLMQVMGAWEAHYNRAVFIDMGVGDTAATEADAEQIAVERGWRFERLAGDDALVRRLIDGDWDDDFLVVPPGEAIVQRIDETIVASAPAVEPVAREL